MIDQILRVYIPSALITLLTDYRVSKCHLFNLL